MKLNRPTVLVSVSMFMIMGAYSTVVLAEKNVTLSQKMLTPVIEYQCSQELKSAKAWKAATFFMQAEQQKEIQKSVCQCVSKHALDDVASKDLMLAAVNETEKNKLIKKAVFNSIRGCAQQALN